MGNGGAHKRTHRKSGDALTGRARVHPGSAPSILQADLPTEVGNNLYYQIEEPYRGRGYGKALMGLALAEAKRICLEKVRLTVNDDNPDLRQIIEAMALLGSATSPASSARPIIRSKRILGGCQPRGDVPSPMSPPSGCHFHTRCPFALQRGRKEEPVLVAGVHSPVTSIHKPPSLDFASEYLILIRFVLLLHRSQV